ncbi:MAG: hypothetical protein NTZ36_03095 [Candidatus Jorgensenbacteria bacterium]|nr:hypothetical protein [Candidatus Jorgensenbacteria bacterium]
MNNKEGLRVKVSWRDAMIYSAKTKNVESIVPALMITVGTLLKDEEEGIVIKDPFTVRAEDGVVPHKENPTFLYVPSGMIVMIEEL